MRKTKYLLVFLLPILAVVSLNSHGIWSYLTVIWVFGLLPALDVLAGPKPDNLSPEEREEVEHDPYYRWALRLTVPVHVFCGIYMLMQTSMELDTVTRVGRILSYGMMCGVIGINVGHEMFHRVRGFDAFLGKFLLTSSLYTHLYLEHLWGHHKTVGTPEDSSTARRGEWVYAFWIRSIVMGYTHAWQVGIKQSKGNPLKNEMVYYTLAQAALLYLVYLFFGPSGLSAFFWASVVGWLLLETVQYIQHYGLVRKKVSEYRYEDIKPCHSWNSDHVWGRAFLFELSRHSDHHYAPHKNFSLLDHHDNSPQLPTGYPGMMLISLIPPLYFHLVHKRIS